VASVKPEAERQRGNQERPRRLVTGEVEYAVLVGGEQLGAVSPRPFLVPNEVALPLDVTREEDGLRFIGVELLVPGRSLEIEHLVALQEVAAAELHRRKLLPRTGNATQRQRAFGIEEVAIGRAHLRTAARAGH